MTVFITGGNGFIGSRVVRALTARGTSVRLLMRAQSRTTRLAGLTYERASGDVRDPASLQAAMAGCTGVIHLASVSNWNDIQSPLMRTVVVDGTRNVLQAMRIQGITRAVFVSSATAINGSDTATVHTEESGYALVGPRFAYAHAKREAEELCRGARADGLEIVIVNPAEVYGPDDDDLVTAGNLIDLVRSRPVLVCTGGTSIVHVDDVSEGIIAALSRGQGGSRYILGGENLSIRQLAELAFSLVGPQPRIITVPNWLIRTIAIAGGAISMPLPFNPAVIPYATRFWFMDASKAVRDLGVRFRGARDVLEPTIAWLRQSGRLP